MSRVNTAKIETPGAITHRDLGYTRIVSYNLHGEAYGWGPDIFKPADPVEELEGFDADVYVLPETWIPEGEYRLPPKVMQWAELEEKNFHHARSVGVVRLNGKMKERGELHTFIITSYDMIETRDFLIPKHRNDPSHERRIAAALLRSPEGNLFWVVGVHLSSRVPFATIHNVRHLRKFIKKLEKTKHPVIVGGDFNLWGWWVRFFLRKNYRRSVRSRTWPSELPHSQIDHILVPPSITLMSGGVCQPGFSDHRAVVAEIRI